MEPGSQGAREPGSDGADQMKLWWVAVPIIGGVGMQRGCTDLLLPSLAAPAGAWPNLPPQSGNTTHTRYIAVRIPPLASNYDFTETRADLCVAVEDLSFF